MASSNAFWARTRAALRAFFVEDVKLERDGGALRVVLAAPGTGASRPPTREELQRRRDDELLAAARRELADLLDADAPLRSDARHLAFVEYALAQKGWRGLHKVRLDVLERALGQFEDLVTNWEPEGLATLRSRMAVTLTQRRRQEGEAAPTVGEATELDNPPDLAAAAIAQARTRRDAPAPAAGSDAPAGDAERAALVATYAALGLAPPDGPAPGAARDPAGRDTAASRA